MHQASTAGSSRSTTVSDSRISSVPTAISNAFALRHLLYHHERHSHKSSAIKSTPPPHNYGTLSVKQYKVLTELLALVCNPDADPGHVMAVSLTDIKGQPPQVRIAINQAHAGQHRDVLQSTRDQILACAVAFGRERICLHLGLYLAGSQDAAVPGAGTEDGSAQSKPRWQSRGMHHLSKVIGVSGDAKHDSTTAQPSDEHIVESLKAIYHFYSTLGRQFEAIFDDVCTLVNKHFDKVSCLRRINYVCWYVRAANFLCNLAIGDVQTGIPGPASKSAPRSLAGWLGSAVVRIVGFPEEAFRLHNPPHIPFPKSLAPPTQERHQRYIASRTPRLMCRKGNAQLSKDKTRTKYDCRFCAVDIDEQESSQSLEAYGGASGQGKDASPPSVHAEVLLAYEHLKTRESSHSGLDLDLKGVGTTPDPVYICSFKKACVLCSQYLLCCGPSMLYTLQSHDMIYYRWRILHSDYVGKHIPSAADLELRVVGRINGLVHDTIPDRLPPDCFPCCKTFPKQCEDLDLDEDEDLGDRAYSTDHWPVPVLAHSMIRAPDTLDTGLTHEPILNEAAWRGYKWSK
ncbi:hypothetical protein F503_04771 [Ophiostoma piceae UAMH 11346]|uniref:Uncharacterized protein n=1 Tax=Ophiostoma piceae (strain UAMH 11346) TaxID=1262450 RepID=S3BXU6_OPHP1|nr:hypothetical protein F503_04771 [Ophiostoma piceae UAMH 11346]